MSHRAIALSLLIGLCCCDNDHPYYVRQEMKPPPAPAEESVAYPKCQPEEPGRIRLAGAINPSHPHLRVETEPDRLTIQPTYTRAGQLPDREVQVGCSFNHPAVPVAATGSIEARSVWLCGSWPSIGSVSIHANDLHLYYFLFSSPNANAGFSALVDRLHMHGSNRIQTSRYLSSRVKGGDGEIDISVSDRLLDSGSLVLASRGYSCNHRTTSAKDTGG